MKRFYHADGFIKSIGHVAYRTIYSPDPRTRKVWRRTTRHLIHVRADAKQKIEALKTPYWPPHHSLWVCISRFEGGVKSVNPNGHYGMLQMSYNWMKQIHGKASDYSQSVQEWAAERAWAANGYSYSFLYGQWFQWDAADGCYTP